MIKLRQQIEEKGKIEKNLEKRVDSVENNAFEILSRR